MGYTDPVRSAKFPTGVNIIMTRFVTTTEIYLNLSPEEVLREFREKW
jgi:hypothetical protein